MMDLKDVERTGIFMRWNTSRDFCISAANKYKTNAVAEPRSMQVGSRSTRYSNVAFVACSSHINTIREYLFIPRRSANTPGARSPLRLSVFTLAPSTYLRVVSMEVASFYPSGA